MEISERRANHSNVIENMLRPWTLTASSGVTLTTIQTLVAGERPVEFRGAGELDAAFAVLAQQPPEAPVVMSDAALYDLRERISALALRHRLPTITYVPEFTDAGALISYGPPRQAMYRRAAD